MRISLCNGVDIEPAAFSIGACTRCPNIHIKLFNHPADKQPVASIDIGPLNLDEFILDLVRCRNELQLRSMTHPEPTHEAPDSTQ